MKSLKNVSASTIVLNDFHGKSLDPNETIDALMFGEVALRDSEDVVNALMAGTLIASNTTTTYTGLAAIDFLRGTSAQVTPDGKPIYTVSDRPKDTLRYFSAKGDNIGTGVIGDGTHLTFWVPPGETVSLDAQYTETVYIKDGQAHYHGVEDHSHLDVEIVVPAGIPFPAELHNGNYDFDGTNWIPNAGNTGAYFILGTETVIYRFLRSYPLMKDTHFGYIEAPEPQLLPSPYKVRVTVNNSLNTVNHIRVCIMIGMYRAHTLSA